jgi:hypothetical protein
MVLFSAKGAFPQKIMCAVIIYIVAFNAGHTKNLLFCKNKAEKKDKRRFGGGFRQ